MLADSRDVAASFGKRHDSVIRDVRNLVGKEPDLSLHNFLEFKNNDLTGETTSHYEMDRRGFTVLAMGFTGAGLRAGNEKPRNRGGPGGAARGRLYIRARPNFQMVRAGPCVKQTP